MGAIDNGGTDPNTVKGHATKAENRRIFPARPDWGTERGKITTGYSS